MERRGNHLYEQIEEIEYKSPAIPDRKFFLNGHVTKKADQLFERPEIPANLSTLPVEEQMDIIKREWARRTEGVFFMNFGQITYITGKHYFYLCYYHMDIGLPRYREADRRIFWFWDYCINDPKCFGMLMITKRQFGKSFICGTEVIEHTTKTKNVHTGIQSKSEGDAKAFFKRGVVNPWRKLPFFFSPKHKSNPNPEKDIQFFARVAGGKNATDASGAVNIEAELGSWIDYADSQDNAYDGEKLARFINDEIFKEQKFNPLQRWNIVKKTMIQSGKVIAKAINTSSVEEIGGKGLERAEWMWKNSNPNERDAVGFTKTGLYRIFIPCYLAHLPEDDPEFPLAKYGIDDIEKNKAWYQAIRDGLKNEPAELMKFKRANPFTIEEALTPDAGECMYDAGVLSNTIDSVRTYFDQNNKVPNDWWYDLHWGDESKTWVYAKPNKVNGRFWISWMPQKSEELNRVQNCGKIETQFGTQTLWKPLNDEKFAIGSDPIDKSLTVDKRNSTPAAHGFRKYDVFNEMNVGAKDYWPSNAVIFEYLYRPKLKSDFHEDLIKACHFFGCQIFFENNKSSWYEYFENRGYGLFLAGKPSGTNKDAAKESTKDATPGAASTPWLKQQYAEKTQTFIVQDLAQDWRRLPFTRTLNELIRFDIAHTQKFDAAVSLGFTLLTATRALPPKPKPVQMSSLPLIAREY